MGIYILVGDEAGARLFWAEELKTEWKSVRTFDHPESRLRGDEIYTDRPDGADGTPRHQEEGLIFARELSQWLDTHQHQYDRLILVGPPRFLGALRKSLSAPVARRVTDTLNKELTHLTDLQLEQRLSVELTPEFPIPR